MIEIISPKIAKRAKGVRESVFNNFAGRTIDNHVNLKVSEGVNQRLIELISEGGVPLLYANHQGHADAMAFVAVSRYIRNLMIGVPSVYTFNGLTAPMASSWAFGQQGDHVKNSYDLLKGAGAERGLIGVPTTREKDKIYGMTREHILAESLPFARGVRKGYGVALLPEGSVQGGRHPKGANIEEIYGIQEVQKDYLLGFYDLINITLQMMDKRTLKKMNRRAFYLPLGVHGSFRIIDSPEREEEESKLIEEPKPKLTRKGILSLAMGALGLPTPIKIEANLLMPYDENQIMEDLGAYWREDPLVFNRYAMEKVAQGVPPIAKGFYGRPFNQPRIQAIELSRSS